MSSAATQWRPRPAAQADSELFLNGKSEAEVGRIAGMAPLGRIGDPREIAEVVAFLVSPEAGWVNGQAVRVNGGIG